jgi:hypothetical protein
VGPYNREFTSHSYKEASIFIDSILLKVHELTTTANNENKKLEIANYTWKTGHSSTTKALRNSCQ